MYMFHEFYGIFLISIIIYDTIFATFRWIILYIHCIFIGYMNIRNHLRWWLILAYLTTMFQLPRLCRVQINVIISYKSESVCMETVVACCKIGLNFITRIKIPRELQYSLPDGPDLCVGICKKYAVDQCTWPSMQWTNVHGQVFWLGSYMLDSAFLKTLPKLKFLWPLFL